MFSWEFYHNHQLKGSRRIRIEVIAYRLLRNNALGGRSIRAGRLLVLHSSSIGVPGSGGSLLLRGREPVEETVAEHFGVES
jgi:hypothetical protein